MVNIIIADDHKLILEGLVEMLKDEPGFQIIGTADNGNTALELVQKHDVDIAILDIEMPGINGIQLSRIISKQYNKTNVLIISMYKSNEFAQEIMASGAKGYMLKSKGKKELMQALDRIKSGKTYLDPDIIDVLINAARIENNSHEKLFINLTKREKEVLKLIAKGLSSIEISKKLFIEPTTVNTHRRNLLEKLNVKSSKELIIFALENKHLF